MLVLARKYLEKIENFPIKFPQLLAWVFFITIARSFLEAFTNKKMQFDEIIPSLIYNPVYYLVHFLAIALIFYILTQTEIKKIVKTIFLFSFFIFIAPLVDYFFPSYQLQSYMTINTWEMAIKAWLTIGLNDIYLQGTSLGVKVEGIIAIVGVIGYLLLKRSGIVRSIFGSFLVYSLIVIFGLTPTIFNLLYSSLGLKYEEKNLEFVIFQYLLLGLFALLLYFLHDQKRFCSFFKNVNWSRGGITLIFFSLGLAYYYNLRLNPAQFLAVLPLSLLKITAGAVAVFLTWQAARLINDLADYEFDRSEDCKNSVQLLGREETINILVVYLFFIAAFSFCLSYAFFVSILLCLILSYFYSGGGLHFKRHFLLASLSEASAFSLIFLSGFFLFFTKSDTFDFIPNRPLQLIFLILLLAVSFKDVKDSTDDRRQSVKTLYTVFGPERGLMITRILILICALLPAAVLKNWLLLIPGLIAYLLVYLVTSGLKNIYRLGPVFLIAILYLVSAGCLLQLSQEKFSVGEINLRQDSGFHPDASQEIWFFSAKLLDEKNEPYYIFQTYSFSVGSFFSLIGSNANVLLAKEFYPDNGKMSATKNQLHLYQYISGYGDADQLYQISPDKLKYHARYEEGMIDLDLSAEKIQPLLLSQSGRLTLLNQDYLHYYAQQEIKAEGKLIFKNKEKIKVNGQAVLEHLWGNLRPDYNLWSNCVINLDNGVKIFMNIFYYQDKSLIYAVVTDGDKIIKPDGLEIKILKTFISPETKLAWPSELQLTSQEQNFNLKLSAQPKQQEVLGQNLWEGLMLVAGDYQGRPAAGWATYRQSGSLLISQKP